MAGDRSIRIDGLRRAVSDLRRSIDFYCGALGFERADDAMASTDVVRLRLGEQHIDLVSHDAVEPVPMPPPARAPDPRFQHAAIATNDMEAAWRRLEPYASIAISRGGPQKLPAHTGSVTAFKFRDPDGHPLELIEFPDGVGDPRWQRARAGAATLGIDHFAIVVASVDASTAFFAVHLELAVTSRDVNAGPEQDRLDGLDGVEVDVVALEPREGPRTPHLELLRYRHPAWVAPTDRAVVEIERARRDEIVCCRGRPLPSGRLLLRDPDGHGFVVDG